MTTNSWVWYIKKLVEVNPLYRFGEPQKVRPYELMVNQSDKVLNYFADSHGMLRLE